MRLNFHVHGDGAPLIILHGFLGSADNWRAMSKRLAAHYKVFSLDLRNHGASPHSPLMDYAVMAEDLSQFFTDAKLDKASLLGHSMGGKVAMRFIADHPKSVDKLMVVDIAPRSYPPTHRPLLAALTALELSDHQTYGDVDGALAGDIADPALRQFLIKNLTRGADQAFHWRIGLAEIVENYDALTQAVVVPGPIATPTCFIRAGRSSFIGDGDIPAIRELWPNAEIVTIADAGHWVHTDAAEAFYRVATRFFLAEAHSQ